MSKKSCIAIVAARSGGHIIPGLTLAQQYCKTNADSEITIFTTQHPFDKKIILQHGSTLHAVFLPLDNVPSRLWHWPKFMVHFVYSFFASFKQLVHIKPQRLIVMGGYISIPVTCAAYLLRIPCDLYELNATPGRATKLLAPLATHIHVCFRQTASKFNAKKTMLTSYPIRFDSHPISCHQSRQELNLESSKKTILVLGGSQGSLFLNNVVKNCLEEHPELAPYINIIHQTGSLDSTDWLHAYQRLHVPAVVFDYQPHLALYYQAADVIICRAGAGTIFETLFFKKPCIVIPLEIQGNDHQVHNAQAIASEYPELFHVIRQQELSHNYESLYRHIMAR